MAAKDTILEICTDDPTDYDELLTFVMGKTGFTYFTCDKALLKLLEQKKLKRDKDGKVYKATDFNLVKRFLHTNMTCPRGEALAREFGYGSMARG